MMMMVDGTDLEVKAIELCQDLEIWLRHSEEFGVEVKMSAR